MKKSLIFRIVLGCLSVFTCTNLSVYAAVSEYTTEQVLQYKMRYGEVSFDNVNNNSLYTIYFKGHTYVFNRSKDGQNITCTSLNADANTGQLNIEYETQMLKGSERSGGCGLVVCAYKEELYLFYDSADPNNTRNRFICYKTSFDPASHSWSDGNRIKRYNEPPLSLEVLDGNDQDRKLNMAAAVMKGKLYFFFTYTKGYSPSDYLNVWTYDGKKGWLPPGTESNVWCHEKDVKYGPIFAQTVIRKGQKEPSIVILTVQCGVKESTDRVSMLFFDGHSTYERVKKCVDFSSTDDYLQVRAISGITNGFGADSPNKLQISVGYKCKVSMGFGSPMYLMFSPPAIYTQIYNYDLDRELDGDFVSYSPSLTIPGCAVPVVNFATMNSSARDGKDLQLYTHYIGSDYHVCTGKSDRFDIERRRDISSRTFRGKEDYKKLRTLFGVIEGVPPFTRSNDRTMNNFVSYSRVNGMQASINSSYSSSFSATGGIEHDLFATSLAVKEGFRNAYESSKSININLSMTFSGDPHTGETGLLIFLEPNIVKADYVHKSWDGRILSPLFSYIYVTSTSVSQEEYNLTAPPEGMFPRSTSLDLSKWSEEPSYSAYNKTELSMLTSTFSTSFNYSGNSTEGSSTSSAYSSESSFSLRLLLIGGESTSSEEITNQSTFSITDCLGIHLGNVPPGNIANISSLKVVPCIYYPNKATNSLGERKIPWLPTSYVGSNPWLLTWIVSDNRAKESTTFMGKVADFTKSVGAKAKKIFWKITPL